MKETDLTGIVADHIDAINAGDTEVATFAEDALRQRQSSRIRRSRRDPPLGGQGDWPDPMNWSTANESRSLVVQVAA
jgi:hypothetical protein